jgi:Cof subfamily protein (haloacid dehalogenase superfamily)
MPAAACPPGRSPAIEALLRPALERLPRPRLLACDIDGTILDERGVLRPAVRDAIAIIVASGVEVVLATGRSPWAGIVDLAARLGLAGPHITMQGALLSVPATGEIHRLRVLPPGVYLEAVRFGSELGIDPLVALVDGHRAVRLPDGIPLFVSPLAEGRDFHYVNDLSRLVDQRPIRVFLPTGPARHRAVRFAAEEQFGVRASIVWSDTTGVEILAPGTHKGEAISWLAATRGLGLDEVAAVGDAPNDTQMLRTAGRSAAMISAPAEVHTAADIVVPSSSESGVIDAFAWFFPDLAAAFLPHEGPFQAA